MFLSIGADSSLMIILSDLSPKIIVNQFTTENFYIFAGNESPMYSWIIKFIIKINRSALFSILNSKC